MKLTELLNAEGEVKIGGAEGGTLFLRPDHEDTIIVKVGKKVVSSSEITIEIYWAEE